MESITGSAFQGKSPGGGQHHNSGGQHHHIMQDMADSLINHPYKGQFEEYLEHLGKGHRRLIEGYTKIIYLVKEDCIYITDFFDTRQDPAKMKG